MIMTFQSQQNDYFNYDMLKVSKMITTCSKSAKWLVDHNKAIHDTSYSVKKVKIDSKRHINYRFLFTWEAVEIEQSKALF